MVYTVPCKICKICCFRVVFAPSALFVNKSLHYQLSINQDLTPSALGSSLYTHTTDLRWSIVLRGGSGFSEDLGSGGVEGRRW